MNTPAENTSNTETVFLGAGCFWCTEAIFARIPGVIKVESGYQGGRVTDPTYEEVCSGSTGHAEVCKVVYDPARVPLTELLDQFWGMHDPTSLNRQGADIGTQYRSVVFCTTEQQLQTVKDDVAQLSESTAYSRPIVTEVAMAPVFYPAENYHQDYYENNSKQPYCAFVIGPKIERMKSAGQPPAP